MSNKKDWRDDPLESEPWLPWTLKFIVKVGVLYGLVVTFEPMLVPYGLLGLIVGVLGISVVGRLLFEDDK